MLDGIVWSKAELGADLSEFLGGLTKHLSDESPVVAADRLNVERKRDVVDRYDRMLISREFDRRVSEQLAITACRPFGAHRNDADVLGQDQVLSIHEHTQWDAPHRTDQDTTSSQKSRSLSILHFHP